jgi:hypothetical protein
MHHNQNKKKWVTKKTIKALGWLIGILLTVQLGLFAINKANSTNTVKEQGTTSSHEMLDPKYYVIQGVIDANNANETTAWNLYYKALHDMKLVSEGKINTSYLEDYMRFPFILGVSNDITTTVSNTNLLRMLKLANPTKYNNIATEFCKIIPKYELQGTDGELHKISKSLGNLNYSLNCLKFKTVKYSIDHSNDLGNACNNPEANDLIKQFNLIVVNLAKARKENIPINVVEAIMLGYKYYISSTCKNKVNELKPLPNF